MGSPSVEQILLTAAPNVTLCEMDSPVTVPNVTEVVVKGHQGLFGNCLAEGLGGGQDARPEVWFVGCRPLKRTIQVEATSGKTDNHLLIVSLSEDVHRLSSESGQQFGRVEVEL